MTEAALDNFNAQMSAADEMRRQKSETSNVSKDVERRDGEGEPSSLRERVGQARRAMDVKEKAKQALEKKVAAPIQQGTSQLLKMSWLNLIDSFGLTLIYINIHVFLKAVLGEKLFCKLGREWAPAQVRAAGNEAVEKLGAKIGIVEVMVLLILDLAVLFAVLMSLSFFIMIVAFWDAGFWKQILAVWSAIGALGWDAVKAIIDLFS